MDSSTQDPGGALPPVQPVRPVAAEAAATAPAFSATDDRPLVVRFTGSGSEYFRIWIVNLLLSIVTLSLYRPWAKVRRLKYFYGNTLVDEQPFDFHGNPRRMLRGYLLMAAMFGAYSFAGRFSPTAALVAFIALAVLWPALLRAALQFRLANTSWRGLRFHFTGDLRGAYAALLPIFLPGLVLVSMAVAIEDPQHPPGWYLAGLGLSMLFGLLVMPLVLCNLKRYQHGHYALGQLQTRMEAGAGSFYGLTFKTIGVSLLSGIVTMIVMGVVAGVVMAVFGNPFPRLQPGQQPGFMFTAMIVLFGLAFYLVALIVPVPYATSRLQNLVWNHTRAEGLRFGSRLRFGPLLGLTVKNWGLMVLTLGLYWPFAAVAMYRLRVESLTPMLGGDLDQLRQRAEAGARGDASGDAAGDLFGIDIGL